MPTSGIILGNGKWTLQRIGVLNDGSTDTGVRMGQEGEDEGNCCVTLYIQARRCDTGALADVWFELNNDDPFGFYTSEGDHTVGPITFTVDGAGDDVYLINGDNPISCNPGTVYTDITLTAPCDNCVNCADGAPKSVTLGGMDGVSLFKNYRVYDGTWDGSDAHYTRWFEFILDRDVIPDNVCLCKVTDCLWAARLKNEFTAAYSEWGMEGIPHHIAENVPARKTLNCDVVYRLSKINPTGVPTDVEWVLFVWIEMHDGDDVGPAEIIPASHIYGTIGVFNGSVNTANCSEAAGMANLYVEHGPLDDPPHFVNGYSYFGTVINPNYILDDFDGCSRRPSSEAVLPLGFIPTPPCEDRFPDRASYTWHGGSDGTASLAPDIDNWCPFIAKYNMTVSGTVKHCATSIGPYTGHSTLDGPLDGELTPDTDTLGLPLIDTFTQYTAAGCATILTDNLGDHMDVNLHDVANSVLTGVQPTIIVFTIGGVTIPAWAGRGKIYGVSCGWPKQIIFTFDPTVLDPSDDASFFIYNGGQITLDLIVDPLL